MSYSRYITAVNTSLREIVLPETQSSRAKDTIEISTRLLAAIAVALDDGAAPPADTFRRDQLPSQLTPLLPSGAAVGKGIRLPDNEPVHDPAVNRATLALVEAGALWLAENDWDRDPALRKMATALLAGDQALRNDAVKRMHRFEQGFVTISAGGGNAGDIDRDALQAYLRKYLGSDDFAITAFRFISGCRSQVHR